MKCLERKFQSVSFPLKFSFFEGTPRPYREKLFYSIQYKNGWLAASDVFDMFTQSIKFYYTLYYTY